MNGPASLCAISAAAALALFVPRRPRLPPTPPLDRTGPEGASWPALPLVVALATPLIVFGALRWLIPAAIFTASLCAAYALWRRRRSRMAVARVESRVLEACEHLASELAAGRPPGTALASVADAWPEFRPTAEAFRVGADVPQAFRVAAQQPGAGDLRLVAAAWQIAHRTGQGLAVAVERAARQQVEARATRRVVEGELGSARATARLVAGLPVVALAMGKGVGGDPLDFLLRSPVGWLCLAGGLALGLAGLWWIEALARAVEESR